MQAVFKVKKVGHRKKKIDVWLWHNSLCSLKTSERLIALLGEEKKKEDKKKNDKDESPGKKLIKKNLGSQLKARWSVSSKKVRPCLCKQPFVQPQEKLGQFSWRCCYLGFGEVDRGTLSDWLMPVLHKHNRILLSNKITSKNQLSQFLP